MRERSVFGEHKRARGTRARREGHTGGEAPRDFESPQPLTAHVALEQAEAVVDAIEGGLAEAPVPRVRGVRIQHHEDCGFGQVAGGACEGPGLDLQGCVLEVHDGEAARRHILAEERGRREGREAGGGGASERRERESGGMWAQLPGSVGGRSP